MSRPDLKAINARCEAHLVLMENAARPLSTEQWSSMGCFERACRKDLPACIREIERLEKIIEHFSRK